MKIIKKRRPDEDAWWVGNYIDCDHCGTTVQLEADDYVTRRVVTEEYGLEVEAITAQCPICGYHTLTDTRF